MTIKPTYRYVLFLASLILCIVVQNLSSLTIAKSIDSSKGNSLTLEYVANLTKYQVSETIEIWEALLKNPQGTEIATIHTNLARAYNQKGDTSNAISHFKQAAALYEKSKNEVKLSESLIEQAQIHNYLGQFTKAIPLLERAVSLASKNRNIELMLTGWGVIGNSYSLSKKYDLALAAYKRSLDLAESLGNANYITTALNNQVNIFTILAEWYESQAKLADNEGNIQEQDRLIELANSNRTHAITAANRALSNSKGSNDLSEVKALLNILTLTPDRTHYQQQVSNILSRLPSSRRKAYSLIKLAKYQKEADKINSFEQAISISSELGDLRTKSFALGELGQFYEQQGRLNLAIDYTQSAILTAQNTGYLDSLYRWQWQAGRIYEVSGDKAKAVDYYKQTIASLQSIRGDIANASRDLQFDVRDEVEPVYRNLVQLLLENGSKESISEALNVIELLKLSELQNFFGDECLEVKDAFASSTNESKNAIVTTLILANKIYIILHTNDTLKYYATPINHEALQSKVQNFRFLLEKTSTEEYLALSHEFYNLLIKPLEADLKKLNPNHLGFINDGVLRNIPMAALHDGKQFLVEKYSIYYALSEKLINQSNQTSQPALIFGLTVKTSSSSALPYVRIETQNVQDIIGGKKILDKEFTEINFKEQVEKQNYSVMHVATHGEFKGTANSSSLQAYNSRISLQEFEGALSSKKKPIELLTLSACQTAAGDDRSTLGLAGLATRTGVSNVLASLWFANDNDSAILMKDFW